MTTRIMSRRTIEILRAQSPTGVVVGAQPIGDGRYAVELDDEVALALDLISADTDAAVEALVTPPPGLH